jgi:hypothetical protein
MEMFTWIDEKNTMHFSRGHLEVLPYRQNGDSHGSQSSCCMGVFAEVSHHQSGGQFTLNGT